MEKKKISAFEFAIMSIADPVNASNFTPENIEDRKSSIKQKSIDFVKQVKIKTK